MRGYKVVSVRTDSSGRERYGSAYIRPSALCFVSYPMGRRVDAPHGTLLFVFKELWRAQEFARVSSLHYELAVCSCVMPPATELIYVAHNVNDPLHQREQIEAFWRWVLNGEARCDPSKLMLAPEGTCGVSWLKLQSIHSRYSDQKEVRW